MPIFHNQDLIFVHIPKNAGKSVEGAFLGTGWPHAGRRHRLNRACKYLLRQTSNPVTSRYLLGSLDYTFSAQHMTLREMTDLGFVTPQTCPGYTSFAVVRNPYDRLVSSVLHHFSGRLPEASPSGFETSLRAWLDFIPTDHNLIAHRRGQFEFLNLDGRTVGVDHIVRYENLRDDMDKMCRTLKIAPVKLGWSGRNERSRDYRDYHNKNTRTLTERLFPEDIEMFGYTF